MKQKGWNDIGTLGVKASGDLRFTGNAVVVTAVSSNDFALKTSGGETLSYRLTTASGGEKTTEFTFESADINTTGGASQDLGIDITWGSDQASGTYTDTITYTGAVQDAATGTTENVVTLTSETGAYEAQDGDVLTGTAGADAHITVAAGATITLRSVDITSIPNDTNYEWAGITCSGDATIILEGTNAVKGGYENYPGIFVSPDYTLTIKGSGSLTALSNGDGAGIGGGYGIACGNIVIEGGTVTATGGEYAAGIGGGYSASCGNIIITNGVTSVTATKGTDAPNSIGAGDSGSCDGVTIASGANVTQK